MGESGLSAGDVVGSDSVFSSEGGNSDFQSLKEPGRLKEGASKSVSTYLGLIVVFSALRNQAKLPQKQPKVPKIF